MLFSMSGPGPIVWKAGALLGGCLTELVAWYLILPMALALGWVLLFEPGFASDGLLAVLALFVLAAAAVLFASAVVGHHRVTKAALERAIREENERFAAGLNDDDPGPA